ncbi:MAG: Sel1 domain protein repeat-containing protein, partial [Deltaproteobacteria bacterium]|nr:Sel1 domain protein repeat-containing protein [Deltaproteobacteria bacterium]
MDLRIFLPSLTNLPVFYAESVLLLLLFSVSSYALLHRLRAGPSGARPAVCLRTRLAVLLPAWALWATWVGFGAYWLGLAGLIGGSWLFVLVGVGAVIAFVLFTVSLIYWLRGCVWADAAMVLAITAVLVVVAVKYTVWLCEPLGHSGFAAAQVCAGRLYAEGRGRALRDPHVATDWYRRAAEAGNAEGQFLLGTTIPVREQREHWLRHATAQGHGPAAYALYVLLGQRDEHLNWLQLAVDQGHPDAQYQLARRLITGNAAARDIPRARTLLQTAASAGSAGAMRELALAYADDGILFDHSDDLSRQWEARALAAPRPDNFAPEDERHLIAAFPNNLERIRTRYADAIGGDPAASQAIAREILAQTNGDATLEAKAYGWLERAAASGSADAQLVVAEYYLGLPNATGAQQERGRHWLITAADTGHPTGLRRLIAAYKQGTLGLDRDLEKAKAYGDRLFVALEAAGVLPNQGPWLSASWDYDDTLLQLKREREQYLPPGALAGAAQAGDSEAQYHLAREVMPRDIDAGIALLHAAADGGFAEAQYHAAHQVRSMKSTPESLRRAVRWLTAAVAQGHRGAMYDLGTVYSQGIKDIGLARDPARARVLFEQALDGGGEVLYRYTGRDGHGWIVTAQQVQR